MKITINAGHSEVDPGAIGYTGTYEATVCRQIAQQLISELTNRGYEVQFLQLDDLATICEQSNAFEAEIFLSLHANAYSQPTAEGTECYYCAGSEAGQLLAVCLQQNLVDRLQLRDRGVKTANFYVIKYTQAPAVLAELAFISNPYEEQLLLEKQEEFVQALVVGIENYRKIIA